VDPTAGARLTNSIVNAKFNKAARDYNDKTGLLKTQAEIEAARANDRRKEAEAGARVKSETAQESAAKAAQAKAERPEPVKPMEVAGNLVDPTTGKVIYKGPEKEAPVPQTIDQYINQVRNDSTLTPEVKEERIKQRISDHNLAHPEKPVSPTTASLAVAAVKDPTPQGRAEARAALKLLGTYNDKPAAASSNGSPSAAGPSPNDIKTVDAIIHGTTTLEGLPSKRREYLAQLVDARRSELPPDLKAADKEALKAADTTEELIDQTLALAEGGLEGVGKFAGPFGAARAATTGGGSQEGKEVRQLIGNIRGTISKVRAGTALSKTEKAMLDTYVPDINIHSNDVVSKLAGLKNYLGILREKTLKYGTRGVGAPGNSAKPPVTTGGKLEVGQRRLNTKTGQIERITSINGDGGTSVPDPD
jgi:hypothetical protein